jgi:hypothetical protein
MKLVGMTTRLLTPSHYKMVKKNDHHEDTKTQRQIKNVFAISSSCLCVFVVNSLFVTLLLWTELPSIQPGGFS